MSGKNITVKDVSARMDQLSSDLNGGLKLLRDEFSKFKNLQIKAIPSITSEGSEFLAKMSTFQESINSSIANLITDISVLKEETTTLRRKVSTMETKLNINSIIIHGLTVEPAGDMYSPVVKFISEKLNIRLLKSDINYCHFLRKKSTTGTKNSNKISPIVVQFNTRWLRNSVFFNKKLLKGSRYLITELLTSENLLIFKKTREMFQTACWTYNGLTYIATEKGRKLISAESDLNNLSDDNSGMKN